MNTLELYYLQKAKMLCAEQLLALPFREYLEAVCFKTAELIEADKNKTLEILGVELINDELRVKFNRPVSPLELEHSVKIILTKSEIAENVKLEVGTLQEDGAAD